METVPFSTAQRIIISVGGSLIVPDKIDTHFLSDFRDLLLGATKRGFSFFIIAGGGKTARRYQDAAREVRGDLSRDDLDWLGIHATRLNAHLLRTLFREEADPHIITNLEELHTTTAPLLVGAGWRPGHSTDHCAVAVAETLGATRLINLSNTDYVYESDPKTCPDAKPIKHLSWSRFRTLIPTQWDPGLSAPFDPIAAREAEKLGLEVAIINGSRLDEFQHYIDGVPFIGTVIS